MLLDNRLRFLREQMRRVHTIVIVCGRFVVPQIPPCPIGTRRVHSDAAPDVMMVEIVTATSQKTCRNNTTFLE